MTRAIVVAFAFVWLVLVAGCAQRPPADETAPIEQAKQSETAKSDTPAQPTFKQLFPHVRADLRAGVVEFDARVTPLLIPDSQAPLFYLEVLVCTPNTREHETLLVTDARPSNIHAALLAAGLKPGRPGGWRAEPRALDPGAVDLVPIAPTGDAVSVRFVVNAGRPDERVVDPLEWTVQASDVMADSPTPRTLKAHLATTGFHVFAGSVLARHRPDQPETYDADGTGQIVGLHTFGSEVIALTTVMNPDAETEAPEWVADLRPGVIPGPGTPVRVRISRP